MYRTQISGLLVINIIFDIQHSKPKTLNKISKINYPLFLKQFFLRTFSRKNY